LSIPGPIKDALFDVVDYVKYPAMLKNI